VGLRGVIGSPDRKGGHRKVAPLFCSYPKITRFINALASAMALRLRTSFVIEGVIRDPGLGYLVNANYGAVASIRRGPRQSR